MALKLISSKSKKNGLPIFLATVLTVAGVFCLYSTPNTVRADAINSTDFVITVKTDNLSTGSSAVNQFTIPTTTGGGLQLHGRLRQ